MELEVGKHIQRTLLTYYDNPDGFINSIKDALFEIKEVNEGYLEVVCVASRGYPSIGDKMGIPTKYLTNEHYFIQPQYNN